MKILKKSLFVALALYCSTTFSAQWMLVSKQFVSDPSGGMWFCTYKIANADIQKSIQSKNPCPMFIND
jgi:hypothetical protein